MTRRGSWPLIALLAAVFLGAFLWQRQRSAFLSIEAERTAAADIAARHGLSVPAAMALRDLVGVTAPVAAWDAAAGSFAQERRELGDPLAAVALAGERDTALAARRGAASAEAAWSAFRTDVRAVPGIRFLALRERFAARDRSRD